MSVPPSVLDIPPPMRGWMRDVLNAMNRCEEIGGPEGLEYIAFMRWLAAEAESRAEEVERQANEAARWLAAGAR